MRNTLIERLTLEAEKNPNIVLLTGDLGTNCLEVFQNKFPDRFINCGIAEQNMVGVASGLALEGKKVFIYSITNFVAERAFEFLRNLVCYHNLDVTFIGVGAGVEYGQQGFTHHGVDELAGLRTLDNLRIFCPANVNECEKMCDEIFSSSFPAYIRINKKSADVLANFKCKKISGITECFGGEKIAILASGTVLEEAVNARDILSKGNIFVGVYSIPQIKPLNYKAIDILSRQYSTLIVLEEHNVVGGLGSAVAEIVAGVGSLTKVVRFGFEEFTSKVGSRADLRKFYHINADSLVAFIKGRI